MRQVQIILIDDIDGSEADRTVQFSLNGNNYEIDLSDDNAAKLEKALEPFITKATKLPGRTSKGRRNSTGGSRSRDIRAWAKKEGIDVPDRGRIGLTDQRVSYSVGFTLPFDTTSLFHLIPEWCGPRPSTQATVSVSVLMLPSSPDCSTSMAGPRGCG